MSKTERKKTVPRIYHKTNYGQLILTDSLDYLPTVETDSVQLVMTSPPFGLVRKRIMETLTLIITLNGFGHSQKKFTGY